jgi:hypothetical protein
MKKLERAKTAKKGQGIRDIEINLSKASHHDAKSVSDMGKRYNQFKGAKKPLRDFYYSQTKLKNAHHYELQKRKCLNSLC